MMSKLQMRLISAKSVLEFLSNSNSNSNNFSHLATFSSQVSLRPFSSIWVA